MTDEKVRHVVCDLWNPYSSYAARYLYHALDDGPIDAGDAKEQLGL